jgi:hypothetical protein
MAATATQDLQDSFLSAICKGQEITLHAIRAWAGTVEYLTPEVSYPRPAARRLAAQGP